jgi:hypothetical protein
LGAGGRTMESIEMEKGGTAAGVSFRGPPIDPKNNGGT